MLRKFMTMIGISFAVLAGLVLLMPAFPAATTESAAPDETKTPVWISPDLGITTPEEAAARFDAPIWTYRDPEYFYPGSSSLELTLKDENYETVVDKQSFTNCLEFLELNGRGYHVGPSTLDIVFESGIYADCSIFRMIAALYPAKISYLGNLEDPVFFYGFLTPLFTGVNCDGLCRRYEADQLGISLRDYNQSSIDTYYGDVPPAERPEPLNPSIDERWGIGLRNESLNLGTNYIVKARGDYNGDGIEDAILWEYMYSLHGTFKMISSHVVTRKSANEILRPLDSDSYLCRPDYECDDFYDEPAILKEWRERLENSTTP